MSAQPGLDGKGGRDPVILPPDEKIGKPTKETSANYVYYRLYTKLGALESNHPIYSNDRFIGRMPAKSFAPPHTVACIKRYLCKFEALSEPDKALIFTPLSSPTPEEDSTYLSLYAPSGPGLSEQDPIVLLVESERRSTNITRSEDLPERSENSGIRYVHYRVYSSEGDEKAKTSFDESDGSLGRINTFFVAPPHTFGSLKACITKIEGLVTPNHSLYNDMELFESMNNKVAVNDTDLLSFIGDTYPGSNDFDPIALVNATTDIVVDQERAPVHRGTSSVNINRTQVPTDRTSSERKFTKRARLTHTHDYATNKPLWLSITNGEIVLTDGNLVSTKSPSTNEVFTGYVAINSSGEKGFVFKDYLALI